MAGWHHWSNKHGFEQAPRDGEGQGGLACYRPWCHKESDWMTEQQLLGPNYLVNGTGTPCTLWTVKVWETQSYEFALEVSVLGIICFILQYACGSMPAAAAKSLQSCSTLCDPIDGSPPGSPVPGILQARTLEWGAIAFSNAWKWKVKVKSLSRVRLLATPPPGPSVHGIFQARVLEWVAIAFSG